MDPYALPPGHTGAAQDHPSPTKRRRVAPPPPSSSSSVDPLAGPVTTLPAPPGSLQPAQTAVHIQPPPLATLPAPLALLSLAVSLRASAHALLPSLAKRPSASSNSSQARYAHAWADYSRLQHALVAVLRAAVTLTATASEYAGGRLELRACAMLAQQLVDMYDGSGHEKIVAPEADRALARAVRSLHSLLSVPLSARELTRLPCSRGWVPTGRSPSRRARVPALLRLCAPRLPATDPPRSPHPHSTPRSRPTAPPSPSCTSASPSSPPSPSSTSAPPCAASSRRSPRPPPLPPPPPPQQQQRPTRPTRSPPPSPARPSPNASPRGTASSRSRSSTAAAPRAPTRRSSAWRSSPLRGSRSRPRTTRAVRRCSTR